MPNSLVKFFGRAGFGQLLTSRFTERANPVFVLSSFDRFSFSNSKFLLNKNEIWRFITRVRSATTLYGFYCPLKTNNNQKTISKNSPRKRIILYKRKMLKRGDIVGVILGKLKAFLFIFLSSFELMCEASTLCTLRKELSMKSCLSRILQANSV